MNRINKFLGYIYIIQSEIICLLFIINLLGALLPNKNAKIFADNDKTYQIDNKFKYKFEVMVNQALQKDINKDMPDIKFLYFNKTKELDYGYNTELSKKRVEVINSSYNNRVEVMKFAFNNGLPKEKAIEYAFPEIINTINSIENIVTRNPQNSFIEVIKNSGNIKLNKCKNGVKIDKLSLFNDIYYSLCAKNEKILIDIKTTEILPSVETCEKFSELRGGYKTGFNNSSESRKNNIKKALEALDGITLLPEESLSFNKTTGIRNEENGYKKAKVIVNGTFSQEFGGGVCQVSTTLYNAALMADLEIIEVHPHSLPVSYVQPCFDAMVNSGSSDLIIKNNTQYPITIATSSINDICLVNIYGVKNNYKIVKISEKSESNLQFEKLKSTDYKKFGFDQPLKKDEERIISIGKPGYKAKGKLEYYIDDVLVKTKSVRSDIYKPTNEVVLVGSL